MGFDHEDGGPGPSLEAVAFTDDDDLPPLVSADDEEFVDDLANPNCG